MRRSTLIIMACMAGLLCVIYLGLLIRQYMARPFPESKAVGIYKLIYIQGPDTYISKEILVLNPDGTYVQKFKPVYGRNWVNTGKWHMAPYSQIVIENRLKPVVAGHVIDPPIDEDGCARSIYQGDHVLITVDEDMEYEYEKVN